ncbi:hypothetical protein Glove_268g10 [Diversispora epigaea]|uniref:Uncharacterized protein n=1 Tax=Diversispora epigaea TaxID=1348612 RepID=A0A397I556_9GLOM|nr:hypothetical protein Glove_268g10 [Diversispora epigaea]
MNISQLSYSKHCILVHNNREYFINYRPIKNCIEILLSNSEILQHFIFKYENKKHQGEKSYAEQNSGNWWKYAEASIPSSACILSLILYSDATTTDTLGKSSLHPIYISLGNIPTWRRNKEDAKQLLGYFPILFAKNEKEKTSPEFKKLVRFAKFLECLDLFFDMLDIILAEDCRIKIFGSVTLKNINILRATNKFQNRPWFSNIAIAMDDAELFEYQSDNGTCYAQTLLITEVILPNKSPFHLALVQWYDFKSKKTPFVYDCPLLKLVEIYNFIEIEAIEEIVHIVPRFDTKDEYFVNKFIF